MVIFVKTFFYINTDGEISSSFVFKVDVLKAGKIGMCEGSIHVESEGRPLWSTPTDELL